MAQGDFNLRIFRSQDQGDINIHFVEDKNGSLLIEGRHYTIEGNDKDKTWLLKHIPELGKPENISKERMDHMLKELDYALTSRIQQATKRRFSTG